MINRLVKNKLSIALLCFLLDLGLSLWSYFEVTNYDKFTKSIKAVVSSPDFQVQIYQVLIQTLTFSLMLFLVAHLIIYFLFCKSKKFAIKYVRFYTFMATVSCVLMIATKVYAAIIPALLYGLCFKAIGPITKESK